MKKIKTLLAEAAASNVGENIRVTHNGRRLDLWVESRTGRRQYRVLVSEQRDDNPNVWRHLLDREHFTTTGTLYDSIYEGYTLLGVDPLDYL